MKKIFYPAEKRGQADFGWLQANYSFSFANYYDPSKMHFGKLRVLNDDIIEAGAGFGEHPHDNMEIVTIPLKGALAHKDSTGGQGVIGPNEVQVMSAGTGVVHSEFNASETEEARTLQIWVLTDAKGHEPRYDQKSFNPEERKNNFQTVVSPKKDENSLWLHQDTYFSLCELDDNNSIEYKINTPGNGVYIFNIEGEISAEENHLGKRDAIGIWNIDKINISANEKSYFLVIEVPMN